MSKEVIIRLRDDLDQSVGADIETLTFEWIDGQLYEIDLNATHVADMEQAMLPYVKAARPIKRKGKAAKRAKSAPKSAYVFNGDKPKRQFRWAAEIHAWATDHGYDWENVAQRRAVREWGRGQGMTVARSGVIPQPVMEAHYAARESGEAPWPFGQ